MPIIHNQQIQSMIQPRHSLGDITEICAFLEKMGALAFTPLPNGLFPAAALGTELSYTGYSYAWVRDNIHIAYAHHAVGRTATATKTVRALMQYFLKHRRRFTDIIGGKSDPAVPMNRPHIRFDGATMEELDEKWPHAQNDALGYFLWLFCKLVNDDLVEPSLEDLEMLGLFARYFEAVQFWEDEDSGHWEEVRKVSASSMGVVIAGLLELKELVCQRQHAGILQGDDLSPELVDSLVQRGREALNKILPAECVQPDTTKNRPYDSALLFLIYPLKVVESEMADSILGLVRTQLQGEHGIRRYLGDSYWAPDYKTKLAPEKRLTDYSEDLSGRDQLLPAVGQEAQWCIFDPIVSCIYGTRFHTTGGEADFTKQTEYLNRSLGQIIAEDCAQAPAFKCPELYYLERGRYVPNDHAPLLWAQANVMLSLKMMEESCRLLG